jgi:hypothetical protein
MKKIRFEYITDYDYNVCEHPLPSSHIMPEWYKNMAPHIPSEGNEDGKRFIFYNGASNASAKKCVPMRDAMTGGYTITLWAGIFVRRSGNEMELPELSWRVKSPVFDVHGISGLDIDPPYGYNRNVFKYLTHFRVRTPPGYSILIKPPAGHYNLPIMPLTAIVDSDKSVIDSNIPCWVRNDFNGEIKKGTPIAQIFPFKRDSWEHETVLLNENRQFFEEEKGFASTLRNNYIKNIWSKKTFK